MAATMFNSAKILYFLVFFLVFSLSVLFPVSFNLTTKTTKTQVLPYQHLFYKYSLPGHGQRSNLSNAPRSPVVEWRKHGFICLCHPLKDLTQCMDIQANPGPSLSSAQATYPDLRPPRPSEGNSHNGLSPPSDRKVYSREELFSLRSRKYNRQELKEHFKKL